MKEKMIKSITVLVLSMLFPLFVHSQYCNNFYKKYCEPSMDPGFKLNGQSKNALLSKGQTSELSIVVYRGQDYRISLCMDENLGSQVEFKVYETVKVKVEKTIETKEMEDEYDEFGEETGNQIEVVNKETRVVVEKQKKLLYDNSTDNFSNEIEFSVENTRRLTIAITVPGGSGSGEETSGKKRKNGDMGCVGVLVEHMVTPRSGF